MNAQILHSGFDGLRFTLQAEITPELRRELALAKAHAKEHNQDIELRFGDLLLSVTGKGGRTFNTHTGELGAVWMFQDPEDRIPNNPGITVDFRALGLATGGLDHAERHFREVMEAMSIPYGEHQLRVSRVDFAMDVLAPWFEPERIALVAPPGTKVTEYTGADETVTQATGSRVTGLRAGNVDNRQLAIYDKRAEVMQKAKDGWLAIWNAERAACSQEPLNLSDRDASQVWRFELRLGSKQLRGRFEMHSWADLRDRLGDAYNDALGRLRYCIPSNDSNRARWPLHELWRLFEDTIGQDLAVHCCGVQPLDVIFANRTAKMRELDQQLLGLFVTRAAISDITPDEFYGFMEQHIDALQRYSEEHPKTLEERLQKAGGKYRWT
ncbi:hypothetical protein [Thalassovita aquimarina]|uniref:Replication initiation factor n=1 Tax=Thalassovita aquimarina TaxID=2785917 RepID=A0ABS5HYS9_9RHOB|nr:hypothetical protein [Thalassovita aquimarina]MBR9653553.1 hypothetical protein [Thalassovita aquimarina]